MMYMQAYLNFNAVAAGTNGVKECLKVIQDGLLHKSENDNPQDWTDAEIAKQAQIYDVSPEYMKEKIKKGWKPLVVFKEK